MLNVVGNQPSGSEKYSANRKLRILLLCNYGPNSAGTVIDHIFGLKRYSKHRIYVFPTLGSVSGLDLTQFDGIIIHYSLIACDNKHIDPAMRRQLSSFKGLKIAFVQDDYRFVDATVSALHDLGIHILFGLAPKGVIDQVYPPQKLPGVRRETVLAGYVPEKLLKLRVPEFKERPVDIGYRARKVPQWLGSFSQEKWRIAERFLVDAPQCGLVCDISTSEEDRIYGDKWIQFITTCKAFLGTESGSSVCDFSGEIQKQVEAHLERDPGASFELLRDRYFKEEDGRIVINVISPRCFEAAALRTLMVLYQGEYSGRLQPWRHYVPLRRDHSNMDEVVAIIRDEKRSMDIVERAYREVALNPENSFSAMVKQVDNAIDETAWPELFVKKYLFFAVSQFYRSSRLLFCEQWWPLKAFLSYWLLVVAYRIALFIFTKPQRQFIRRCIFRVVGRKDSSV
jgi:hypothetical protein